MDRGHWARRIAGLDPEADHLEIYRIMVCHEFPWDMNQALSLALFRTYAVPRIGGLLARTGEFVQRTQKRYEDTALILGAVLEHGPDDPGGRAALRRMNQMHRAHDIGNDDLRYVLSTFVVMPMRWTDAFGWRRFTEAERVAATRYFLELGDRMGLRDLPQTWEGFVTLLDDYEREHFAYDEGARAVADATLALLCTLPPQHLLPVAVVRRLSLALLDDPLLDAFRYPRPHPAVRAVARTGLRGRARVVRLLPPRVEPLHVRAMATIRGYPDGFDIAGLGTFPVGPDAR